jgi:hypothetical protein
VRVKPAERWDLKGPPLQVKEVSEPLLYSGLGKSKQETAAFEGEARQATAPSKRSVWPRFPDAGPSRLRQRAGHSLR